jgi:ribosomal protein S18 acetylase RimI-like enzyme
LHRYQVAPRVAAKIRACRRHDLAALEWSGMFTDHRAIIRDAFERHCRGENVFLVADLGGFPAGQVWIDLTRKRTLRSAVIWALRVFPSLQNKGMGGDLMRAAEHVAAARGFLYAELAVELGNPRVIPFYERLGYRRDRRETESFRYVTPDGRRVDRPLHLLIYGKKLGGG